MRKVSDTPYLCQDFGLHATASMDVCTIVRDIAIRAIGFITITYAAHYLYHTFSLSDITATSISSDQTTDSSLLNRKQSTDQWDLTQWTIAGILTAITIFTLCKCRQAAPPPPQQLSKLKDIPANGKKHAKLARPSLDAFNQTLKKLSHESNDVIERELSQTYQDGKIALHHKELFLSAIPLLEKIAKFNPEKVCRLLSIQMPEYLKTPLHCDESYLALDQLFRLIRENNPSALIKLFSIQDINKETYISSHANNFKIALHHLSLISEDGNFAAELLALFQIRMWLERTILFNPDIIFSACPILLNLMEKGPPDVQIATVGLFVEAFEFLIEKSLLRVKEATIHNYRQLNKDSQPRTAFCNIIKRVFDNQEIDEILKRSLKRVLYDDPSFQTLWPYTEVAFKEWPPESLTVSLPPSAQNFGD